LKGIGLQVRKSRAVVIVVVVVVVVVVVIAVAAAEVVRGPCLERLRVVKY